MGINSVITLTTGVPGAGKTYVRAARFLVDDFLINSTGIHISNFPLNVDAIADTVYKKLHRGGVLARLFSIKRKNITLEDIKSRIEVIPDVVLQSWKWGRSGPWDYFRGRDLRYCHIAIDEIHNFVSDNKPIEYLQQWDDWLGEVRHMGCTFEGLTQDITQVAQCLVGRASIRLEIVPGETLRDPFFKISMGDWYELKACLTGEYHKTVFEIEKRKTDRRFVTNNTRRFLIVPEYFQYYNSFSASLSEKADGIDDKGRAPLCEYQKRTKIGLIFWFIRRNLFSLFSKLFLTVGVVWLCFFGGFSICLDYFMSLMGVASASNTAQEKTESKFEIDGLSKDVKSKELVHRLSDDEKARLKVDIAEEKRRLEEAKKKKEEEEKQRFEKAYRLVFITENFVVFANGKKFKTGDVVDDTNNKNIDGRKIEKIDFVDRAVYLGGSFVLRM